MLRVNDETLCFCGSGKRHEACHGHIGPASMAAKLYRARALSGASGCKACRSPFSASCLPVTETEFVLMLDALLRRGAREELKKFIKRSKADKRRLETENPGLARKINGRIPPEDLILLFGAPLPFPCVFLEGEDCAVSDVRPLLCRGEPYPHGFLFLEYGDGFIFRRPLPLFCWFSLVFEDETMLERIDETPFFRNLLSLGEREYIERLAEHEVTKKEDAST
jgi:Fe-S-cluster containining protein